MPISLKVEFQGISFYKNDIHNTLQWKHLQAVVVEIPKASLFLWDFVSGVSLLLYSKSTVLVTIS